MNQITITVLISILLTLSACSTDQSNTGHTTYKPISQTNGSDQSASQSQKNQQSNNVGSTPSNAKGSKSGPSPKPATTKPAASQQCRQNVLAGVYHPSRLTVIDKCKTVSGTVEDVKHEADHDYHIRLKLDKQYAGLINSENVKVQHGDLVLEVIPMDEGKVPSVSVGQHITVTGAYVQDGVHGWREIHPVWNINGKGTIKYTVAEAAKSVQTGVCGNGDSDCHKDEPSLNTSSSSSSSVTITNVDLRGEVVTIHNGSSKDVNLSGWKLVSETGDQVYYFPDYVLKAGADAKVESGRSAQAGAGILVWSHRYIWNNDGDPAALYDAGGKMVSEVK